MTWLTDMDSRGPASVVYKFFDERMANGAVKMKSWTIKTIIRKLEKQKVHSSFIDNIWGADLADMQLWENLIKEFVFVMHCWCL